jgi:hypothetical protein
MLRTERLLSLCSVLACAVMAAFHACCAAAFGALPHALFAAFWAGFAVTLWRERRRWVRELGEVEKRCQDWEQRSYHDGC